MSIECYLEVKMYCFTVYLRFSAHIGDICHDSLVNRGISSVGSKLNGRGIFTYIYIMWNEAGSGIRKASYSVRVVAEVSVKPFLLNDD